VRKRQARRSSSSRNAKIWQIGSVFFSGAGILYYGDFFVKDLAIESLQNATTLDEGLKQFTAAMVPALTNTMFMLRQQGSPAYEARIGKSITETVFGALVNGVPTIKVRYFMSSLAPDGSVRITPFEEECPGEKCVGGQYLVAMGEHDTIDRYNSKNEFAWIPAKLPSQLRDFVQMQIDEEPRNAAAANSLGLSYRIHVASPISVLEISPMGAHWANIDGVEMNGRCSALPMEKPATDPAR
jgi:hypothetical protein